MTIQALEDYLRRQDANFELIRQNAPIRSTREAAQYYDIKYAAPALVVQTERGLMLLIASAQRGRLDFKGIAAKLGLSRLKLADSKKAEAATGYSVGAIPLVGAELPCIFDDSLLKHEFIYGGSGDEFFTLKIAPRDVKALNRVLFSFT